MRSARGVEFANGVRCSAEGSARGDLLRHSSCVTREKLAIFPGCGVGKFPSHDSSRNSDDAFRSEFSLFELLAYAQTLSDLGKKKSIAARRYFRPNFSRWPKTNEATFKDPMTRLASSDLTAPPPEVPIGALSLTRGTSCCRRFSTQGDRDADANAPARRQNRRFRVRQEKRASSS